MYPVQQYTEDQYLGNVDNRFLKSIERDTTPEMFDRWANEGPVKYSLKRVGDAFPILLAASEQGNVGLIRHIVKVAGLHIINHGSKHKTPLNSAINCQNDNDCFLAVKELVRLGADVNMENVEPRYAPLFQALAKQRIKTIKLLLNHGAVMNVEVTELGQAIMNTANEELKKEKGRVAFYSILSKRITSPLNLPPLPKDLQRYLTETLAHQQILSEAKL